LPGAGASILGELPGGDVEVGLDHGYRGRALVAGDVHVPEARIEETGAGPVYVRRARRVVAVVGPDGIAVGPHAVWVANSQDGTVVRIDPVTYTVSGPIFVGAGPAGIAVTSAAVWVANSLDLTVSRLDPATGRVTATVGVGDGPGAIAAASDGVWVVDQFDATLRRIDPRTNQVSLIVSVGSSPQAIAAAGSGV